jgi:hypothetical protein
VRESLSDAHFEAAVAGHALDEGPPSGLADPAGPVPV